MLQAKIARFSDFRKTGRSLQGEEGQQDGGKI